MDWGGPQGGKRGTGDLGRVPRGIWGVKGMVWGSPRGNWVGSQEQKWGSGDLGGAPLTFCQMSSNCSTPSETFLRQRSISPGEGRPRPTSLGLIRAALPAPQPPPKQGGAASVPARSPLTLEFPLVSHVGSIGGLSASLRGAAAAGGAGQGTPPEPLQAPPETPQAP